ncbi:MAG TPA: methyltransferase domain-containing protein [Chitinophagaceae bacterium]|nr:methyltransferase domain-containing protein [Chitinophagaceae bacterium]
MQLTEYHKRIVDYYAATEHAYRDSWDLDRSLAIHYGYWDEQVRNFPASLRRMNEVMMLRAAIGESDYVLDAGCGVGGSAIFLAKTVGCRVTGISLSERQIKQARQNASVQGLQDRLDFAVMDYCNTAFPAESFSVVWGCESICYAQDKKSFIHEAARLLRKGGRVIVADGFVSEIEYNHHPHVRRWLDGWQVNYLETPQRFSEMLRDAGFGQINYGDISRYVVRSSRRLLTYYFLANLYLWWRRLRFAPPASQVQKGNISACRHQYVALKKGLWQYGMVSAVRE